MSSKIVQAIKAMSKVESSSRPIVLKKISKSCGEECLPLYKDALKDSNPKMRMAGIEIMAGLYGNSALESIEDLCNDKAWRVRSFAKKTCLKLELKK